MEVDSVEIFAILSMSYISTRIVKTWTSVAKISRVPVGNQITTLRVVKIAIKFSPCMISGLVIYLVSLGDSLEVLHRFSPGVLLYVSLGVSPRV